MHEKKKESKMRGEKRAFFKMFIIIQWMEIGTWQRISRPTYFFHWSKHTKSSASKLKKHKTGENSVYITAVISVSATSRIYVDLPLAVQGH